MKPRFYTCEKTGRSVLFLASGRRVPENHLKEIAVLLLAAQPEQALEAAVGYGFSQTDLEFLLAAVKSHALHFQ